MGFSAKREEEQNYWARVGIIGESACWLFCRARHKGHSPSGFEWGYLGSGPAQLALAILCDYLGEPQLAVRFYHNAGSGIMPSICSLWAKSLDRALFWLGIKYSHPQRLFRKASKWSGGR